MPRVKSQMESRTSPEMGEDDEMLVNMANGVR